LRAKSQTVTAPESRNLHRESLAMFPFSLFKDHESNCTVRESFSRGAGLSCCSPDIEFYSEKWRDFSNRVSWILHLEPCRLNWEKWRWKISLRAGAM